MLSVRPVLEVGKFLWAEDVVVCRGVCTLWNRACSRDELWLEMGEAHPSESIRQCFHRCDRGRTVLASLTRDSLTLFPLFHGLSTVVTLSAPMERIDGCSLLFFLDGSLLCLGGGDVTDPERRVVRVECDGTVTWVQSLLWARIHLGAIVFHREVYVFGGIGSGFLPLKSVEKFDLSPQGSEECPPMSETRFLFSPCRDSHSIYITGGWGEPLLEVFCPLSQQYTRLTFAVQHSRSISTVQADSLCVISEDGISWCSLRTMEQYTESFVGLPPGHVAMNPLLLRGEIWCVVGSRIVRFRPSCASQ